MAVRLRERGKYPLAIRNARRVFGRCAISLQPEGGGGYGASCLKNQNFFLNVTPKTSGSPITPVTGAAGETVVSAV